MSCIRAFKIFLFICSILSGALFAIVWRHYELAVNRISNLHSPVGKHLASNSDFTDQLDNSLGSLSYGEWLHSKGFISEPIPHEELSYGENRSQIVTEASYLFNETKVLCMVLASTRNRSRALLHTWTQHCNEVVFFGKFSDSKNEKLVKIQLLQESLLSPQSFCRSFVQLLSKRSSQYDWLLIASDKTYAIVENLRHYLSPANASVPVYIGRPVHHYFLGVYNDFDSGIVLSRAAVNLLANSIFTSDLACVNINTKGVIYSGNFDAFVGMELSKHGVKATNSMEERQGTRFHPFMPEKHLVPELISVFDSYWSSNVLPIKSGLDCCSEKAITFTGFSSVTMYFIEYLLYHLAAFTHLDGTRGLGNRPNIQTHQVPSGLDRKAGKRARKHTCKGKRAHKCKGDHASRVVQ